MMAAYHQLLEALRKAFPQPVSDPIHDAYFVYSISRALDQVDALKGESPILGQPVEPDFEAARRASVSEAGHKIEDVIPQLVHFLEGMFIWGHPQSQVNVVPPPSIASIIGVLLPSTYNPNLCSEEGGRMPAEAEARVVAMVANLLGYDPQQAGGVFTFGGTGAMLYGVKLGLEKAQPGCIREGVQQRSIVVASQQSHYSALNVAGWLGIGEDQVRHVPTLEDNSIDVTALETVCREALEAGESIATIIATMGTTDAFGIDDLEAIYALRERLVEEYKLDYQPHIHADAVIGWAWCAFNDYDFEANPLGFRGRTLRALAAANYRIRHLPLADSIGVDFHKTGFAPYVSSLILVRDARDFRRITRSRERMPYLYQTGQYHPGMFTLETTRSGTGPMAALASLLLLGKQGLRTLLGHAVTMAEVLREQIESHPNLVVLNDNNVGPVTLFRVYPADVDTFAVKQRERHDAAFADQLAEYNRYNRRVFEHIYADALQGRGVAISFSECYRPSDSGEPIAAMKSYVLSPFSDEDRMRSIVDHVLTARKLVEQQRDTAEEEPL